MKVRKANLNDVDEVIKIYQNARLFMKKQGNDTQWINGYPSIKIIQEDIKQQNCYLCVDNKQIHGVFVYIEGEEETYQVIEEGNWLNEESYGTIHRLASCFKQKGIASCCIEWCFHKRKNLRADTHRNNKIMQHVLVKNGFVMCGKIYVLDGTKRMAYQKIR